ncbi:hypothetical protein IPL44_02400 [Candidatus Saccharibacteria bacterium]|nr:MAG: hypothetical protein IPL44_02400 [Candidatus Saccharibacteria bacterium]
MSAIYRITSEAVGVPRYNPVGFARLYIFHHSIKLFAPWGLGGLLFNNNARDLHIIVGCVFTQLNYLRLDRQYLLIFYIGAFAYINVVHQLHIYD